MWSNLRKRFDARIQRKEVNELVVKSERGRRRYIVFEVSPNITKESLIRTTNSICKNEESLYIIQCNSSRAIIRCSPDQIGRSIEIMNIADSYSRSILMSGTLKTLRDRYPELKNNASKKH